MQHGVKNFEVVAPRSRFYQGGFGRLFPDLAPWAPALKPDTGTMLEEHMKRVAKDWMTENATRKGKDSGLPAGYTFFGQFIDHDITLDLTALSDAEIDPNRLHNGRTPRLDLDCVYGLGPEAQPYLYARPGGTFDGRMLVGRVAVGGHADLPRVFSTVTGQATALIGDHRNDENAVVSQLQLAFIQAHNALVGRAPGPSPTEKFEQARHTLRWLYQWVVLHDFLPRVCHTDIVAHALHKKPRGQEMDMAQDAVSPTGGFVWQLGYKDIYHWRDTPFMPVEFSVAAYRFGHTLVRQGYKMNGEASLPIFAVKGDDLRGFRSLEASRVIDWQLFLQLGVGSERPQVSRAFDPLLVPALSELPEGPDGSDNILNVLAARNLVRGVRLELPSGPNVAKALGIEPIDLADGEPEALWYYLLREAELQEDGKNLGAVGSIIVASTLAGLLLGDPLSFLNIEPCWNPDQDPLLSQFGELTAPDKDGQPGWTLASIIKLAGQAAKMPEALSPGA